MSIFRLRNSPRAAAGLTIRFAEHAVVFGNESADRATLRHQLRVHLWLGNTEAVTNLESGDASRGRLLLRGTKYLCAAAVRPLTRLAQRRAPQCRYALARALQATGVLVGAVGIRVRHH